MCKGSIEPRCGVCSELDYYSQEQSYIKTKRPLCYNVFLDPVDFRPKIDRGHETRGVTERLVAFVLFVAALPSLHLATSDWAQFVRRTFIFLYNQKQQMQMQWECSRRYCVVIELLLVLVPRHGRRRGLQIADFFYLYLCDWSTWSCFCPSAKKRTRKVQVS